MRLDDDTLDLEGSGYFNDEANGEEVVGEMPGLIETAEAKTAREEGDEAKNAEEGDLEGKVEERQQEQELEQELPQPELDEDGAEEEEEEVVSTNSLRLDILVGGASIIGSSDFVPYVKPC